MHLIRYLPTLIIIGLFLGCNSQTESDKISKDSDFVVKKKIDKPVGEKKLLETWVSLSKSHFQIIEIKDSLSAVVFHCFSDKAIFDKTKKTRLSYFKSDGEIDIWHENTLAIKTNRFHFYYHQEKDTLYEMAETGRIDTLVRVYSDSTIEY